MKEIICANLECGIVFGIPDHVYAQARRLSTRAMVCPNGHRSFYTESEEDRLKVTMAAQEAEISRLRENWDRLDKTNAALNRTISYWKGRAHRARP